MRACELHCSWLAGRYASTGNGEMLTGYHEMLAKRDALMQEINAYIRQHPTEVQAHADRMPTFEISAQ